MKNEDRGSESMKIVVLNGSPKGDVSVTMQYAAYIRKKFPGHEYRIVNAAAEIRKIEKDPAAFAAIIEDLRSADLVLWAFPLYYLLVSSQFKQFIELLFARGAGEACQGKYAASLSTSIHFMDHLAHRYIRAVSEDLGMQFLGAYSAEMADLLDEKERARLETFVRLLLAGVQNHVPVQREYAPLPRPELRYIPGPAPASVDAGGKKIVIVTDATDGAENLAKMAARVSAAFAGNAGVETISLHDADIHGGCLGCLRCGYDNRCIYTDGYREFFETKLVPADIIVIAGTVRDRYLSAQWKQFFDRSFFLGHTPGLAGKQIGFVIEGPLRQLPHLREALTAWAENQRCNAGFVTDEVSGSAELDGLLDAFAGRLAKAAAAGYIPPPTFYSVGGHKIFRDKIYGRMRLPFQADYRYYAEHGMFDFPQCDWKTRAGNALIIPLTRIPAFRNKVFADIKQHMVRPFETVL